MVHPPTVPLTADELARHLELPAFALVAEGAALADVAARVGAGVAALLPDVRCTVQLADAGTVPMDTTARPTPRSRADLSGLSPFLAIPLLDETRRLGVLRGWRQREGAPSERERAVLERAAEVVSLAALRRDVETTMLVDTRVAAVGTLAAGVAHELNNPLAFLLGNISFVRARLADMAMLPGAEPLVRDIDEALADCLEGARRVESIVRDLRAFARSAEEQPAPVELRKALELAVRMVFNEVRHTARLTRDLDGAPVALADEGRLVQVVAALLVHAAQTMPERASDENEVVLAAFSEGGEAVVEVRDNGAGIPAEELPRIFDPFVAARAHAPTLGLAVSRGLLAGMNGRISVESTPGQGSRVRVTLPLAPAADGAAHPDEGRRPDGKPGESGGPPYGGSSTTASAHRVQEISSRRLRLLVVDDETLVGAAIRRLVGHRYEVIHVEEAKAALALCQREPFDAVLCDAALPSLNGPEMERELTRARPELARRVGFILQRHRRGRPGPLAALPEDRLLDKPFSAESVQALVEHLVA